MAPTRAVNLARLQSFERFPRVVVCWISWAAAQMEDAVVDLVKAAKEPEKLKMQV